MKTIQNVLHGMGKVQSGEINLVVDYNNDNQFLETHNTIKIVYACEKQTLN